MNPIIISDGQATWAADWGELKAEMLAQGWDLCLSGCNARAVEPAEDDYAYTRLCEKVASIGGEGSEHDLPETDAGMTYAPAEGPGTWILHGVNI